MCVQRGARCTAHLWEVGQLGGVGLADEQRVCLLASLLGQLPHALQGAAEA
jgi:hypothetical protein